MDNGIIRYKCYKCKEKFPDNEGDFIELGIYRGKDKIFICYNCIDKEK